ncbi:MAG: N-acetylgalactosamine 6-sulfate sulfatase, partial [Bacteroidetes bacterium]
PILSRNGIAEQTQGESSMLTVDAALAFIEQQTKAGKPYLAVVWFGSPHSPHEALPEDVARYGEEAENLRHFYGEITAMDRAFGKLRATLTTLPGYENTLLWYTSDNGGLPEIGRTGGRGHKGQIYEGGLRVPAMLQWPARIKQARISSFPANTSDLFPTVLEIAGLPAPNYPLDGISLLKVIEEEREQRPLGMGFWQYPKAGVRTPSREWMSELLAAQQNGNMTGDSSRLRLEAGTILHHYPTDSLPGHAAWLEWPWKLHRIAQHDGTHWELYQLEQDSMETHNVFDQYPEQASQLQARLAQWQHAVVNSLNGNDY